MRPPRNRTLASWIWLESGCVAYGLVFEAHRLLCHSTLGLRVVKKRKRRTSVGNNSVGGVRVKRLTGRGRGTIRAEDAQGTPTQSHISPSILVYEDSARPSTTAPPNSNPPTPRFRCRGNVAHIRQSRPYKKVKAI